MTPSFSPADVVTASYIGDTPLVVRASTHPDPEIRVAALGSFHRLEILDSERLASFMRDDDHKVRRRAVELAARIDDADLLLDRLIAALDDEPTVAEMAAFVLGEIGPIADPTDPDSPTSPAVEHLEKIVLGHEDALVRESAVAALGALHSGRATILAALADKATVRRRAIIALAPFDGDDITAALQHALDDRDWQVRQAAEDLLA